MPRMSSKLTVLITNKPMLRFSFSRLAAFLLLIMVIAQACSPEPLFDNTKKVPGSVWKEDDVIRFEVPIQDTNNLYRFFLNIRHSTDYRYAIVFFFINTTFPDGQTGRDTVECILADRSGKWLGRGITNIRDNQVMLRSSLRFPQQGVYVFEFRQAMREAELKGIKDIGLRIIK